MPYISSAMSHPTSTHPAAVQRPIPPHAVLADMEAQWIFTEEELANTPSIHDGMSMETERERRTKGINFIMQVGMTLKLPQLTLSTAAVFFHRFLMRHSLVDRPGQKALHQYVSSRSFHLSMARQYFTFFMRLILRIANRSNLRPCRNQN